MRTAKLLAAWAERWHRLWRGDPDEYWSVPGHRARARGPQVPHGLLRSARRSISPCEQRSTHGDPAESCEADPAAALARRASGTRGRPARSDARGFAWQRL